MGGGVQGLEWVLCNYVDTYIIWMNNKLHHLFDKTGLSSLFSDAFTPRMNGSLDEVVKEMNKNMSGLKTTPEGLNTNLRGEGMYRDSVIDYVNDLNEHPKAIIDVDKGTDPGLADLGLTDSMPLDKGKAPDRGLTDMGNTDKADKPKNRFSQFSARFWERVEGNNPTVTVVEDASTTSTVFPPNEKLPSTSASPGFLTPRVYSRVSGSATPVGAAISGIGVALVTETFSQELEDSLEGINTPEHPIPAFVESQGSRENQNSNSSDSGLGGKDTESKPERLGGDFQNRSYEWYPAK